MREMGRSLDEILGDDLMGATDEADAGAYASVTFRIPHEYKAKYDRIQEASRRRFSKKVRKALLTLIDLATARAS